MTLQNAIIIAFFENIIFFKKNIHNFFLDVENYNDDDGNGGINRSELRMIKKIFKRALRNCCLDNDGGSNDNNNDYIFEKKNKNKIAT